MKKKVRIAVLVLLIITALFLFTNLYRVFLCPLNVGEKIDSNFGDLILVLGGGLKQGYQIGFSTEERLNLAVELYRQKKRVILVSDGSLYKGSPAIKKVVDFLAEKGVSKEDIQYEGKSQTTYDNFIHTREVIEKGGFKEVIVCTSPYHQKRSRLILDHLDLANFKIAEMPHSEIYSPQGLGKRLRNIRLIFREYFAILKFYILKR